MAGADPAAMCAKTRAETHEPKNTLPTGPRRLERLLQREEHRRAAHVAEMVQRAGACLERMRREDGSDRLEHIAAAGMHDNLHDGPQAAIRPEPADGAGGELGHGAVEEIAELAVALLKAKFVALGGQVQGVE